MKITIKKGPVSLEIICNPEDMISTIQDSIYKQIPIHPSEQRLNTISGGSIIRLESSKPLNFYDLSDPTIIYLEQYQTARFGPPLLSEGPVKGSEDDEEVMIWVRKAVKSCEANSLDKFLRLKADFERSSVAKETSLTFRDIVNKKVEKKWTCVHFACKIGHSGLLQELISIGADINLETEDHWTPLQLTCFYGYVLCAEILLNQPSVMINNLTEKGTALHLACAAGHYKIAKLLMDSHASPFIEDFNHQIPLQLATKPSIIDLIPLYVGKEILIKYGSGHDDYSRPSPYSGELFWTATWLINDKYILLILDTDSGMILQYNKKVNFMNGLPPDQSFAISEVQDIKNVEESSIENKYFIHIRTEKDTYKYYSKNIEVSATWAKKLLDAVKFFRTNLDSTLTSSVRNSRLYSFIAPEDMEMEDFDEQDPSERVSYSSFEIIEEIGAGSYGKVFKALKKTTGMRYALKVINKDEVKRNNQYKYIIAECKILKSIKHPFIIEMFWAFQTPANIYMVFEFCPYSDLSKLIKNNKALTENDARFYISETLLAIEYLHSMDIVYRDLKPQNILIDEAQHVKLGDFGLAKTNTNKANLATTFCGSPGYLAPEIIKDQGVWKPADIYSLGICLYELLTGDLPFKELSIIKLYKQITTGKINFPNNLSNNAKSLILAMTNKNPEKRPGIPEIKAHPFFECINWKELYARNVTPPLIFEETRGNTRMLFFEDKDYTRTEDILIKSILN